MWRWPCCCLLGSVTCRVLVSSLAVAALWPTSSDHAPAAVVAGAPVAAGAVVAEVADAP